MGYHAVGRATEVGLSSWPSAYWDEIEQCMFLNWMEIKVSQQKMMSFFPDALSYEMCFFHSLFCYFSSGRGTVSVEEAVHRVFPNLSASDAKYAATILTKYLRALVGVVEGLNEESASKDFRYGPANELYVHPEGGSEITGARGGWGLDVINASKGNQTGAMVNYLTCLGVMICKAGRILAGYQNCAHVYAPPCCHFINASNEVQICNFLSHVLYLHKRHPKFNPLTGEMKKVTFIAFACYLMWLEKVVAVNIFNIIIFILTYSYM